MIMHVLLAMLAFQPPYLLSMKRYPIKRYPDESSSQVFIAQLKEEEDRNEYSRGKRSVRNRSVTKRERPWAEGNIPGKRKRTMPDNEVDPNSISKDLSYNPNKRSRSWSLEDEQTDRKRPCLQEKEFQPNNLRKRKIEQAMPTERPQLKRKRTRFTLDDSTKRKIHWLIPVHSKRLRLWKQKPVPNVWEIVENLNNEDDQIRYMRDAIARGEDINACKKIKTNPEQAIYVTALNQLIYADKVKFIEFLLQAGADVNKVSQVAIIMGMHTIRIESETPLDTAVKLDKEKIAKVLLTYHAKITEKTKSYARCYASPKLRSYVVPD